MRPRFDMHPELTHDAGILFPLLSLLFVLTIITVAAVIIVWYVRSHSEAHIAHRDPLEIAKVRFAKGEITKTELNEIRKELKSE